MFRIKSLTLGLAFALLASPSATIAQDGQRGLNEVRVELEAAVSDYAELWDFSGAVLVALNGETLHSSGHGMANIEHGAPNTEQTPIRIASLSKQFTAAAVLLLQDAGRLDIDLPVSNYLPELSPQIGEAITLRQILNHTSGLVRDVREMDPERQDNDHFSLSELIALINQTELQSEPGSQFAYSNAGYNLAAAVIEHVTGRSFGTALDELIFSRYGMASSSHVSVSDILPGRASAYFLINGQRSNGAYFDPSSVIGGGSIATSTNDLLIWSELLQGHRDGLPDLLRTMIQEAQPSNYSMGWYSRPYALQSIRSDTAPWLGEDAEGWAVYHSGVGGGVDSYIRIYLDHGLTVVVLSNQTPGYSSVIARALAAIATGRPAPPREHLSWNDIQATLFSEGVDAAIAQSNALSEQGAYGLPGPEEMLRLVDMLLTSRRLQDGIIAARFFVGSMPEYKYAHALLGEAYRLSADYDAAIQAYDAALALDPDDGMIAGWRTLAVEAAPSEQMPQ
jgi:CubicO group peptidase (beta-lactamase class C family)